MENQKFTWTDENIKKLKVLWEQKVLTQNIANAIGKGCTKNAVIGKARRLGLAMRGWKNHNIPKKKKEQSPPKPTRKRVPTVDLIKTKNKSLDHLSFDECKYPYDKVDGVYQFCASKKAKNRNYCPHHDQVCYKPERTKKDLLLERVKKELERSNKIVFKEV